MIVYSDLHSCNKTIYFFKHYKSNFESTPIFTSNVSDILMYYGSTMFGLYFRWAQMAPPSENHVSLIWIDCIIFFSYTDVYFYLSRFEWSIHLGIIWNGVIWQKLSPLKTTEIYLKSFPTNNLLKTETVLCWEKILGFV